MKPEVWLRGPIPGVPALLQPVAHGLLQCREELRANVTGLTTEQIWTRPSGAASIGFHTRHAAGSLDRLFTYARGERLSSAQQAALAAETDVDLSPNVDATLVGAFDEAVERALEQLQVTRETTLLDARGVGRAQLPSTVLGLLFHAAEHTQRHVGQVVTTAKMFSAPAPSAQWKDIVWQQFGAAIDMLENALLACPDELWSDRSRRPQFWYVVYHTLFFLDLYLSESEDGFAPPAPFTLAEMDPAGRLPERPYTKDELHVYLDHGRKKCRVTIEALTDEKTRRRCGFEWIDVSEAELLLYNMRHVQHHAAQLNLILRQTIDSAPGWVAKAL